MTVVVDDAPAPGTSPDPSPEWWDRPERTKLWWLTPLAVIVAIVLLNDQPTWLIVMAVVLAFVLAAATWPPDVRPVAREFFERLWDYRIFTGVVIVLAVVATGVQSR